MELHRLDGLDATGIDRTDIHDTPMYMDGIVESPDIAYEILDENGNVILYADADENIYEINGLSGFFKKIGRGLKKFVKKVGKKIIRPVVRTFNRFLNPATILLRNGFLLAMKVDMMKVARKLRFGYLNEAQARKMGIDMRKFHRLRKIVSRAERIYRAAGGKSKNLRKAILRGKGYKDRKVPLSGFDLGNLDEPTLYNDPFEKFVVESDVDTIEAFLNDELQIDGLGAVTSAPAMAAASGAVAGVAALLSKIGNIFGKANQVKQQAQTLFQRPRRLPPRRPPIRFTPSPSLPQVSRPRFTPSVIRRNQSITSSNNITTE